MTKTNPKEKMRELRHKRIRRRVVGTSDQPRVHVHRSLKNFYVQVIDDASGKVLFSMSTMTKNLRDKTKNGGNIAAASSLGEVFAVEAQKNGITKVCFDRGGYLYHGRVKAFAEAARKAGMEF